MTVATAYETVIGLEVHVQLCTESKMFCGCRADYQQAPPNSRVCPVCLGLPGTLPVINRRAVEYTIMTGLALHCTIPEFSKFDRKNYPYPDLMKGYQISQYDLPLAENGWLEVASDDGGAPRRPRVRRVHLEEDVAKLHHIARSGDGAGYSLVDVNRSGVPLMEVVSEPDLRSPAEARAYLTTLHSLLQYLGVTTGNMQDGSFRCDANISLRPAGSAEFGTRTEIKNMNSFRSVFLALSSEVERQRQVLDSGGRVVQETRGWLEEAGRTVAQRSKEEAHDYRYFPEPDLPPLVIDPAWVEELREKVDERLRELREQAQEQKQELELASQRSARYQQDWGLPEYDANLLTAAKPTSDFFEAVLESFNQERAKKSSDQVSSLVKQAWSAQTRGYLGLMTHTADAEPIFSGSLPEFAKQVSNWMLGDLLRLLNLQNWDFGDSPGSPVTPQHLVELIGLVDAGTISSTMAKTVLEESFETGAAPGQIVERRGYTQLSDAGALAPTIRQAIDDNPKAVADYRNGKENATKFLVGQVMKLTRGQAKPDLVNRLIVEKLEELKAAPPPAE